MSSILPAIKSASVPRMVPPAKFQHAAVPSVPLVGASVPALSGVTAEAPELEEIPVAPSRPSGGCRYAMARLPIAAMPSAVTARPSGFCRS